jgi:hypothetical protein
LVEWSYSQHPRSKGFSSLSASIGTTEEQFMVSTGKINISGGYIQIKDQTEPCSKINILGGFDKNREVIDYMTNPKWVKAK